jgi:hypothetical protein
MKMSDVMSMQAGAQPVSAAGLGHAAGNQSKTSAPPPSALSQVERTVSLG